MLGDHQGMVVTAYDIARWRLEKKAERYYEKSHGLPRKELTLFHHTAVDPVVVGAQYLAQAQDWFDSMWNNVSRDQPR
jgi:hypothetical protein